MNLARRIAVLEDKDDGGGFAVIPMRYPYTDEEEEAAVEAWCAENKKPRPPLIIIIRKFCFSRMDAMGASGHA
jgi:hypothetical protein